MSEKSAPSILTFNNQLLRVKADVTPALCIEAEDHLGSYIEKINGKFAELKSKNQVANYLVYENLFRQAWDALKRTQVVDKGYKVSIIIAQAWKHVDGVEFLVDAHERRLGYLTLPSDPQVYEGFPFEWLKAFIDEHLAEAGIAERANPAHLYLAYRRASQGQVVSKVSIQKKPAIPQEGAVHFKFVADLARGEVSLIVFDLQTLLNPEKFSKFIRGVKHQLHVISQKENKNYIFLEDYLSTHLLGALHAPKIVGVGMPLCIVIGVDSDHEVQVTPRATVTDHPEQKRKIHVNQHAKIHHAENEQKVSSDGGQGGAQGNVVDSPILQHLHRYSEISIAEDKLSAQFASFDTEFYKQHEGIVPADVLQAFFKSKGVKSGVGAHLIAAITQAITQKRNLTGMSVAIGKGARPAKIGYLFPVFEFALAEKQKQQEDEAVDIREMQRAMVVDQGDLVAEVRYKEAEQAGLDIEGNIIEPPPPESFKVSIGENINEKSPGKYYAAAGGMPVVKHNYIMLKKNLSIEGDVNLASGNIHFKGDVEVKGSIDTGSLVEAAGDLNVMGKVCSGDLKIGGNLIVKEGIITDGKATIRVNGDLKADFVENSRLHVKGNIEITRSMVNCIVICGGKITLKNADSVISGGKVYSWSHLYAANIGLARGAATSIYVGVNASLEEQITRLEQRFQKISAYQEATRLALREMQARKGLPNNQLEEKKEEFREKLVRCRTICEKVDARIAQQKSLRTFNTEARLLVPNQLRAHTKIEYCGKGVPLQQDYAGVGVKSYEGGGRHAKIVPIEEIMRKTEKAS